MQFLYVISEINKFKVLVFTYENRITNMEYHHSFENLSQKLHKEIL